MPSTPRSYTHLPSQADLFYFCTTLSTSEEDLNIRHYPPSKSSLKVGVLVLGLGQVQLLDLAAVDTIAMIGRNRLARWNAPEHVLDEAVDEIDIRYVSETGEGSFSITSGARMPVTSQKKYPWQAGFKRIWFPWAIYGSLETKNSFENAPQFDVLIIPGSFSTDELPVSATTFVTTQTSNNNLIAVMSVASGVLSLVQTGFLHQKRATGPTSLLPTLQQRFPETSWQETRWTRHDSLWTSSSAITAIDMLTAWMREYFWDRSEAVECALSAAGVARLDDEYE